MPLAVQPPAGPVYVSIPLDDWEKTALEQADVRTVSTRVAPDPARIQEFANRISSARNPVLIYGAEIEKAGGWDAGVALAEKLNLPVFRAPSSERMSFPDTHPFFQGQLPPAMGPLGKMLAGNDLLVVIGAPVFRYYPYIPGPIVPDGAGLLQITNDPTDSGSALIGDSLLSDAKLALEALLELVESGSSRPTPPKRMWTRTVPDTANVPLTANEVYATLSEVRPKDAIVVEESPSNFMEFRNWWPTTEPGSYFTYASGGLGHNAPSAVGVALAQKSSEPVAPSLFSSAMGRCNTPCNAWRQRRTTN